MIYKKLVMKERTRCLLKTHDENRRKHGPSCSEIRTYQNQAEQSVLEIRRALAAVGFHIGIAEMLSWRRRNEAPPSLPEFRKPFEINKCPEMLLGPSSTTTSNGIDLKIIEFVRAHQKFSSVEFEHLDGRQSLDLRCPAGLGGSTALAPETVQLSIAETPGHSSAI